MRIRLTRKLSQLLNGIDISRQSVGDVIDLPRHDAELLLAEGWAAPAADDNFEPSNGGNAVRRSSKRRQPSAIVSRTPQGAEEGGHDVADTTYL